jgi:hypothetical protein
MKLNYLKTFESYNMEGQLNLTTIISEISSDILYINEMYEQCEAEEISTTLNMHRVLRDRGINIDEYSDRIENVIKTDFEKSTQDASTKRVLLNSLPHYCETKLGGSWTSRVLESIIAGMRSVLHPAQAVDGKYRFGVVVGDEITEEVEAISVEEAFKKLHGLGFHANVKVRRTWINGFDDYTTYQVKDLDSRLQTYFVKMK